MCVFHIENIQYLELREKNPKRERKHKHHLVVLMKFEFLYGRTVVNMEFNDCL